MELEDFAKLTLSGQPTPFEGVAQKITTDEVEPVEQLDNVLPDSSINDSEPSETEEAMPTSEQDTVVVEDELPDEANVDLDEFSVEEQVSTPQSFDFSELGKDLGVEIKSKEDLLTNFNTLKEQISKLEKEKESVLTGIPENLQKAIELSKSGGDYLAYLKISNVDYSSIDPVEFFEHEVAKAFTDTNGNFDEEGYTEYIESVGEVDKKLKGKEIQQRYITNQLEQERALQLEAARKKEESDTKLRNVINSVDNIAGFKLKPNQKEMMFSEISSGKMINELFYDKQGNYDFKKIVDNYFKIKNFEKIQNFYQQRVKTATKKEILNDLTNPEIKRPTSMPNATPQKVSPLDAYLQELKGN